MPETITDAAASRYAVLGGVKIECETIDDAFEKSIARYEFPYQDGALLEDLGQKARVIRLRCFFLDDRYEDLPAFQALLDERGLLDLIHPVYGEVKGCIEAASVRHDEKVMTAEVDITFVENLRGQSLFYVEPQERLAVKDSGEAAFLVGQAEQETEIAADVLANASEIGTPSTDGVALATADMPASGSWLSAFVGVAPATRRYVAQIQESVNELNAYAVEVVNLPNTVTAAAQYGISLPGRIVKAAALVMERLAVAIDSLRAFPKRFLYALDTASDELIAHWDVLGQSVIGKPQLAAHLVVRKHLVVAKAQRLSLEAAYCYRDDEATLSEIKKQEGTLAFDILGNYRPVEALSPTLTAQELEETLAIVREALQAAIDSSRGVESLKTMSVQLLTYVNTVKLNREQIVPVVLDNMMPLHLVCLRYGLPYSSAQRIMTINRLPRPNFSGGAVNVYAR